MNQILSTGDNNEKSNINNVIKVFCVILVIFAIFLISIGVYSFIKNKKLEKAINSNLPTITIETKNGTANLKVTHTKSMDKIVYSWNEGEKTVIKADRNTQIEKSIIVPSEDCTLNISVFDIDGIETKYQRVFKYDPNADIAAPEIKISAVPGKIKIDVEDNKEMSYITYKWNDEEPIKVEASGEELNKMSEEIEVRKGNNKLKIVAVDKSGNTKEEEQEIIGASKPKINVSRSGSVLTIKITDDDEVKKVVYNLNGTVETKENTGENKQEFEFNVELKQGENLIAIQAYNKSGLTALYTGKATIK